MLTMKWKVIQTVWTLSHKQGTLPSILFWMWFLHIWFLKINFTYQKFMWLWNESDRSGVGYPTVTVSPSDSSCTWAGVRATILLPLFPTSTLTQGTLSVSLGGTSAPDTLGTAWIQICFPDVFVCGVFSTPLGLSWIFHWPVGSNTW